MHPDDIYQLGTKFIHLAQLLRIMIVRQRALQRILIENGQITEQRWEEALEEAQAIVPPVPSSMTEQSALGVVEEIVQSLSAHV